MAPWFSGRCTTRALSCADQIVFLRAFSPHHILHTRAAMAPVRSSPGSRGPFTIMRLLRLPVDVGGRSRADVAVADVVAHCLERANAQRIFALEDLDRRTGRELMQRHYSGSSVVAAGAVSLPRGNSPAFDLLAQHLELQPFLLRRGQLLLGGGQRG